MKKLDPYIGWKTLLSALPAGYAIKDYKKYQLEMEKSKDLTQEQKDELKKDFIGVYNSQKIDICNDYYNDRVKIDFDNL